VLSQLRVGVVELGVINVGLDDPGLEIVRHQASRHATEEVEGVAVRRHPGALIHAKGRADEHVAAHGQDHDEAPDPAPVLKGRIEPPAQIAVVDLGLLAGGNVGPQNGHLVLQRLIGELQPDVASKA
jgi:hypothetical protein